MFDCDFKVRQEYYEPLYNRRYFVVTQNNKPFLIVPSPVAEDDEIIIVRIKRIIRALKTAYGVPKTVFPETDAKV